MNIKNYLFTLGWCNYQRIKMGYKPIFKMPKNEYIYYKRGETCPVATALTGDSHKVFVNGLDWVRLENERGGELPKPVRKFVIASDKEIGVKT